MPARSKWLARPNGANTASVSSTTAPPATGAASLGGTWARNPVLVVLYLPVLVYHSFAMKTIALLPINALSIVAVLLTAISCSQIKDGRVRSKSEIAAIEAALESYKADFGGYPRGNSALIAQRLLGRNSKNKLYLEWRSGGDEGFLLDPWGRSYRFSYSEDEHPIIRSLGENPSDVSDDKSNSDI